LANLLLKSGARTRGRAMLSLYLEHPYGDDPEARQAYMDLVRR